MRMQCFKICLAGPCPGKVGPAAAEHPAQALAKDFALLLRSISGARKQQQQQEQQSQHLTLLPKSFERKNEKLLKRKSMREPRKRQLT